MSMSEIPPPEEPFAANAIQPSPSSYQRWKAPSMDGREGLKENPQLTARDIEVIQQQAYDEGHQRGYKDGFTKGDQDVQRLSQLMAHLAEPFNDLDEEVEVQLVALVKAVVRQLVRREMKQDPGQIVAVVREALAALPVASRQVKVHLQPEDAALVREALSLPDDEAPWKLVEDPILTRGDCRVLTETSRIDATLEARLTALIADMLGGARERDQDRGQAHDD